jgi:hypothetical protein
MLAADFGARSGFVLNPLHLAEASWVAPKSPHLSAFPSALYPVANQTPYPEGGLCTSRQRAEGSPLRTSGPAPSLAP